MIDVQVEVPSAPHVTVSTGGARGLSAYEIAVTHGYTGTEADWLESLRGEPDWAQIEEYVGSLLSSGGSIHVGDGPPPDFIYGARISDVYIDTETGDLYRLGE